jgi:hypothetical protein
MKEVTETGVKNMPGVFLFNKPKVSKNTEKRLKINDVFLLVYLFSGDSNHDCTPKWGSPANKSEIINNNIQEFLFDLYESRIDTCWYR